MENKCLKIYKIFQTEVGGYDTYSDAVVMAFSEEEARKMHPAGMTEADLQFREQMISYELEYFGEPPMAIDGWPYDTSYVTAHELGRANPDDFTEPQIVCASYHAG